MTSIQYLDANTLAGIGSSNLKFCRSTDGGLTWTQTSFVESAFLAGKMTFINPNQGWVIAGGTPPKILSTTDGGRTWQPNTTSYTGSFAPQDIHFVNANTGWAVGANGVILTY